MKYIVALVAGLISLSLFATDVSQFAENKLAPTSNSEQTKLVSSGANKKMHSYMISQQVNAKGQGAIDGSTARKQRLETEKLKVQSEKYQAEIARQRAMKNQHSSNSQQQPRPNNQLQSTHQEQALEKTKTMMPAPSFLEQESNQNQAEIKAGNKNKVQFYNMNDNQ